METKEIIDWFNYHIEYLTNCIDDDPNSSASEYHNHDRNIMEAARYRLVTAERMAEALRGIADRHEGVCCDVKQWTVDKCDNALKQWENLK